MLNYLYLFSSFLFSAHHKQAILIILIPFIFTMINDKHYHHTIMLLLLPQYRVIPRPGHAADGGREPAGGQPGHLDQHGAAGGRGGGELRGVGSRDVIAWCRSPGSGSSRPPTATPPTPASTTSTCSPGQQ